MNLSGNAEHLVGYGPGPRCLMRSVARFALACRSARSRRFIDMKASIKITIDAMTRTKPMKYSDTEFMQSGFTPAP